MHVNARSSNHDPNHVLDREPKRLSERDSSPCEHSQIWKLPSQGQKGDSDVHPMLAQVWLYVEAWGAFHQAFCQCFSLTTVISYWNPCIWLAESKFVSEKHWQNTWWNAPLNWWLNRGMSGFSLRRGKGGGGVVGGLAACITYAAHKCENPAGLLPSPWGTASQLPL